MKKIVLVFGVLAFGVLSLFQLSHYAIISSEISLELLLGGIALVFFAIGIYISKKTEKKLPDQRGIDEQALETLGISKREYEVLKEIAAGLSNYEIAEKLFVTESTVKTHVSSLLVKLDVKRRTQAVRKAHELCILPN